MLLVSYVVVCVFGYLGMECRSNAYQSKLGRFYSNQNKPRRTKHIMGFHAGECVWGVMWAGTRGDLEMA